MIHYVKLNTQYHYNDGPPVRYNYSGFNNHMIIISTAAAYKTDTRLYKYVVVSSSTSPCLKINDDIPYNHPHTSNVTYN